MVQDKYNSVWVSHSSMGDFLRCPRLYFLRNVYKNARGNKINLITPALSLGQAVHGALEGLSQYKAEERFLRPLENAFEEEWKKVSGKKGGFKNAQKEAETKERGKNMIARVARNPGPLLNKTVKIKEGQNGTPPHFYLSQEEDIVLCGRIDWLEYIEKDDSIRVVDFKTGKNKEDKESLQLPIYSLLLMALQKRKVSGASYWYVDKDDAPLPVKLPEINDSKEKVLFVARKVKIAREKTEFACPYKQSGCFACRPFEKIISGEAEFVGFGDYRQELYIV